MSMSMDQVAPIRPEDIDNPAYHWPARTVQVSWRGLTNVGPAGLRAVDRR